MRIAITADVHISKKYPERGRALESIIQKCEDIGVKEVIVAGDCFDGNVHDASFIDSLPGESIKITILRGNHDVHLRREFFTSPGINVVEKPLLRKGRVPILLLPYREGSSMGNEIKTSPFGNELVRQQWVLISHGDFGRFSPEEKGGERGYFPLTRRDLQRYSPAVTILGHIHRGHEASAGIHYAGSPFPLDITEVGPRTFLILDTENLSVERLPVPGSPLNEILELISVPGRDEGAGIYQKTVAGIENILKNDALENAEDLTLRIRVRGYAIDRRCIEKEILRACSASGITPEKIDLEYLFPLEDSRLEDLAVEVEKAVSAFQLDYDAGEVSEDDVLQSALEILYG